MITIGRIPRETQAFFKVLAGHFSGRAWDHFWGLVLAMTVAHGSTVDRLAKWLRGSTHRTNHGEFLWRSVWNESVVMQQIALDMLRSLHRKDAGSCYLILDETQTLKRARKMAGVGKLFHHATGKYGIGHTILKACLHCGTGGDTPGAIVSVTLQPAVQHARRRWARMSGWVGIPRWDRTGRPFGGHERTPLRALWRQEWQEPVGLR